MKSHRLRLWLPLILVPFTTLLLWWYVYSERQAGSSNLEHFRLSLALNSAINVPAVIPWQHIYRVPFVCDGQGNPLLFTFRYLVLLVFVGIWWFSVGLECDVKFLFKAAARSPVVRGVWIVLAAIFQAFAISAFYNTIRDPFFWLPFFGVFCWGELLSLRFFASAWKTGQRSRTPVPPSL